MLLLQVFKNYVFLLANKKALLILGLVLCYLTKTHNINYLPVYKLASFLLKTYSLDSKILTYFIEH